MTRVLEGLLGVEPASGLPVAVAWITLAAAGAAFLGLLFRRVRAYEVVR